MTKRSPEEVLDALDAWEENDTIDAEMERVLATTPEVREQELRAAGVDVEGERVKAREWRENAGGGERQDVAGERAGAGASVVAPLRAVPRRSASRFLMPFAAVLAGLLGVMVVVGRMSPSRGPIDTAPFRPPSAGELRKQAFAACDAQRWEECLRGLDAARELDSVGERDARVREYRLRAEGALKKW